MNKTQNPKDLPSDVPRLNREGKTAVLYSPGFGAGWFTWNTDRPEIVFDREIAEAVLAKDLKLAETIAANKYPGIYLGGAEDLQVAWIPEGSAFEIDEYDGNESIHIIGERKYFIA